MKPLNKIIRAWIEYNESSSFATWQSWLNNSWVFLSFSINFDVFWRLGKKKDWRQLLKIEYNLNMK